MIGGLLARSQDYSAGVWSTHHYYHADGNGNITYLLDVLHNLTTDHVQLAFGDANSSALVTVPERDDYKYVVMPMRI